MRTETRDDRTRQRTGKIAQAVLGYNPVDPDFHPNAHRFYREIADRGPLFRTDAGMWTVVSHEASSAVLRDPRFGRHPARPEQDLWDPLDRPTVGKRSFEFMDQPDHGRLRRLVSKAFTARRVADLAPRIEQLTRQLLDDAAGTVDVIWDFALPLAMTTIAEMLGAPAADHKQFKQWSDAIVRGLDPDFLLTEAEIAQREQANAGFCEYFADLAAERHARPRGDLISELVAVEDDGDVLSRDEVAAMCLLLLAAGQEALVHLVSNGTYALLRNPRQLARIQQDPGIVDQAVDELLRFDPPVALLGRSALSDVEVLGHTIRTGEVVWILVGAANRDPAVFTEPDELDLTRANAAKHLSFAAGMHFCLGVPLARLESRIALPALLSRQPALLTEKPAYRKNVVMYGFTSLPVALHQGT